jgi:hypothetical protein
MNEANDVRRIFNLFLENRTLSRTIAILENAGIKPKAKNDKRNRLVQAGRWTIDSLNFVLQNKAYVGLREVNKVNKNKDQEKLKAWQRSGIAKASWPSIIDPATFDQVQYVLDENRKQERSRLDTSTARVFAASGLCICVECGRKLVGQSAHGRNKVHRYYVHSTKKGDDVTCKIKRIKADQIEAKIGEYVAEILLTAGHFDKIEERIRKSVTNSPEVLKAEKARLTAELQRISLAVRNTFKIQSDLSIILIRIL